MNALLKIFKTVLYTALFLGLYLLVDKYGLFSKFSSTTHYTVTADTKIDPNSELAKYVTQEEIEAFGFGSSDIVCDKEKNATLVPLRAALDRKDTDFVVKFIKDNNLTADVEMRDKRTPLMYSSFRNDVNTFNALLNLGAGIRAKDRFGLSPMAYAIMLNSVDTAKILLEKGVKFEEVEYISPHIHTNRYYDSSRFDSIIVNGDDNITIRYKYEQGEFETDLNDPQCIEASTRYKLNPFEYTVDRNLPQMAELMLSTGYKPKEFEMGIGLKGIKDEEKNRPLKLSGWAYLGNYENYEPMLEVFIKYDLPNAPNREQLKEAYGKCYKTYLWYKVRWIDGASINKKRPFYVDMPIKNLEKYCTDPNGTFQNVRSFISWANEQKKMNEIIKIGDTGKVIYVDSNRSKSSSSSNLQTN